MHFRELLYLSVTYLVLSCGGSTKQQSQPNVLFIAVDDLRPELGCYGAEHIHSPNIDKLASQSTLFENAYCNIPVCGASRASILTGLRPTISRFKSYLSRADEDAPGILTLPGLFKKEGYTTISNGKILHNRNDSDKDWDEIWRAKGKSGRDYLSSQNLKLDTVENQRGFPYENVVADDLAYKDGKMTEKSIADLKRLKKSGKPFFLGVGYLKPHLPFNAPAKYWNLYPAEEIRLPPNTSTPTDVPAQALHNFGELRHYSGVPADGPVSDDLAKTLIRGYYACVSYTDALVGELLEALDELQLSENTVIILWGDHGWNLYEHGLWCKHSNYRTSLQVPLLVKKPGQESGYKRSDLVEFVDIYPTLTDLCNFRAPEHLEGSSLVPLLATHKTVPWKNQVESVWHNGFTYTSENYAYTEWISENAKVEAQMLFDHRSDPNENENLMNQSGSEEIVKKLQVQVRNRLK